jgi:formylglycine-generating enzyme required for sulfatase activity
MGDQRVTCGEVRQYYLQEAFLRHLLRVLARRRVVLCAASEPVGRHHLCCPRLRAESLEALSDQIGAWLEAALAGLAPGDVPPAYPSLHYAVCRHWPGGRDVVIEVDADEWQQAWRRMEPVVGVMEALGVPYTLRYGGHCSPHLCVADEDLPEPSGVAEAVRSREQLVSDLGGRLNAFGAIHLYPLARLPYSLHENTGLACIELQSPTSGTFEPSQAHPARVSVSSQWPPEEHTPRATPLLEWARAEREVTPARVMLFTSSAPTPAFVSVPADHEPEWHRLRRALREEVRRAQPREAAPPHTPAGMTLVPAGPFITGAPWTSYELDRPAMAIAEAGPVFLDIAPVTAIRYREFVGDGGYRRRELWSAAGWEFRQACGWRGPLVPCDAAPPEQPVRGVSCFEAEAYARWAGKRLPTFLEWEKACRGTDGRRWPWGDEFEASRCNTADRSASDEDWAPTPVGAFPGGASPYGCLDLVGNVWEWVQGDLCIGGSFVSHLRRSSCGEHYGIEPHLRTAKLGFRCARDASAVE